jgi:hypothetical protein
MSIQTWQETLVTAQVAGPTLSTFTTAATILPSQAIYTIPSNCFYVGKLLKVKAWGQISSFTSGTFTLNYSLGTLASPISVWTPGAITTIISLTNITWELELDLLCRSIGSGTAAASGPRLIIRCRRTGRRLGSVQNLSHIWSGDGFGLRDLRLIERPH